MAYRAINYRRVYVWEFPVRMYHWVNAICVVLLIATGYLIGNPLVISGSNEAYQQYWFGTVRFIHFVTAFVFFFNFLFRIYWGFVGNRYSRWSNFIPYRKEQWAEFVRVLRVDILQASLSEKISMGHNALASFTYFRSFLVFLWNIWRSYADWKSAGKPDVGPDPWDGRTLEWTVPSPAPYHTFDTPPGADLIKGHTHSSH